LHILTIFRDLLPLLALPQQHLALISQMFMSNREPRIRSLLASILDAMGKRVPELAPAAALVSDLNASSAARLDEPDFERRCGSATCAPCVWWLTENGLGRQNGGICGADNCRGDDDVRTNAAGGV
jgi:hypothetical protein